MKIIEKDIDTLKEYENNPRINDDAVQYVANSIKEFGFKVPVVIDKDNVIVAGHTRVKACRRLGIDKVPCIVADDLTDEQVKAYRLADNKLSELSFWDFGNLETELKKLDDIAAMSTFGFKELEEINFSKEASEELMREKIEEAKVRNAEESNEEYQSFVEKFKPKVTTDDCYTPEDVREAVKEWVANEYGLNVSNFVYPFFPGGDFEKIDYKNADVVVDNPPFSIMSKILDFYLENDIKFFLYAPYLTLFSGNRPVCYIVTDSSIVYQNGAVVKTSFITNLEKPGVRIAGDLHEKIKALFPPQENKAKYDYPDEVITSAQLGSLVSKGINLKIPGEEMQFIRKLDCQVDAGLYGGAFLISQAQAQAKAQAKAQAQAQAKAQATQKLLLSDREKKIVEELGRKSESP